MGRDPIRFLPPSFPQLWKTLWKSRECREAGSRKPDFLRFFAEAKGSGARIFVFLSSQDRQERLTAAGVGLVVALPLHRVLYEYGSRGRTRRNF